jgi:ubiquinone/menaquinone biosynthesis C-methylase UbiE
MINAHYDDDPARYSALRTNWLNTRRRLMVEQFLVDAEPGQVVLELGSGTGDLLVALAQGRPDIRFVGVEPLANYVEFAAARAAEAGVANTSFVTAFAEDLADAVPGLDAQWVFSSDVLHHVPSLGDAARNLAAATRPGGRWLVIEPSWCNPYMFAFCLLKAGERNFWPRPFLAAAAAHGWRQVARRHLFLIPSRVAAPQPWLKALERRVEGVPGLGAGVAITLQLDGGDPADPGRVR